MAAAAALAGLLLLAARPRFAAGLLLAVGTALTLHYLGLLVAAWRAIGEVGEVALRELLRHRRRAAHPLRRHLGPPHQPGGMR